MKRMKAVLKEFSPVQLGLALLATVVYGAACLYLIHKQAIGPAWDDSYPFVSDFPVHIGEALAGLGQAYSLNGVFIWLINALYPVNKIPVAAFMAFFYAANIYATLFLLRALAPKVKMPRLFLLAWLCNFAMSVYIPGTGPRYIGNFNGNLWHNHTYATMRFFAALALPFFFQIASALPRKIPGKPLVLFGLFFTLATGFKPSFALSFSPVIAITLLVSLFKTKGRSFFNCFIVGCMVLPSVFVAYFQNVILQYGDGYNAIVIGFTDYFAASPLTALTVLLKSLGFPILTAVLLRGVFTRLPYIGLLLGNTFFAFAEFLFLLEQGERATHYNFLWGANLAVFFLFVSACALLANTPAAAAGQGKTEPPGKGRGARWKTALLWPVAALHAFSGLHYFALLLMGRQYFTL